MRRSAALCAAVRAVIPGALALLAVFASAGSAAAAEPAAGGDPWLTLERVRASLIEDGPAGAEFVQTYVPAGFSTGEEERGRLALALPDCLRWDYEEPYPKSFLLCGEEAFYLEPRGRAPAGATRSTARTSPGSISCSSGSRSCAGATRPRPSRPADGWR